MSSLSRSFYTPDCLVKEKMAFFFSTMLSKACFDRMTNVAKMTISLFDRVEDTVVKGENAGDWHFLLFPLFSKASFFRVVKKWKELKGSGKVFFTAGSGLFKHQNRLVESYKHMHWTNQLCLCTKL